MEKDSEKEMESIVGKEKDDFPEKAPTEEIPTRHTVIHTGENKREEKESFPGALQKGVPLRESHHEFSEKSPVKYMVPSFGMSGEKKAIGANEDKTNTNKQLFSGVREESTLQGSNPNSPPPRSYHHDHPPPIISQRHPKGSPGTGSTLQFTNDAAIAHTFSTAGAISPSGETVRLVDRKARSTPTAMSGAMASHFGDGIGTDTWHSRSSRAPSMVPDSKRKAPTRKAAKGNALHLVGTLFLCAFFSVVVIFRNSVISDSDGTDATVLAPTIIKRGTTKFFGETVGYRYPAERFAQLDNHNEPIEYVVCVLAATHARDRRDAIRHTWSRNNNRVFFGVASRTIDGDLKKEFEGHQDLILIEKDETYENLAWKSMAMFYAVTTHLNNFQYIWKTDDDVYVRVNKLSTWLNHPKISSSHFIGNCRNNAVISRIAGSKWYVSPSAFTEKVFPPYSERSYAISKELGRCIKNEVRDTAYLPPEDALVGVLARQCNYTCSSPDFPLFGTNPEAKDKTAMIHFGPHIADGVGPMEYFQDAHRRSCESGSSLRESCVKPAGYRHGRVQLFGEEVEYRFHNRLEYGAGSLNNIDTVVCVVSKASSSRARDLIRKTWAQGFKHQNVFFGVSGPFADIKKEFGEHGDLIWVNREETADNRAWKVMTMFHVMKSHVPSYRYITKTDDDAYIQSKIWVPYLHNLTHPYVGVCKKNVTVNRNPLWKSYVPMQAYPKPMFPAHAVRGSYAVSQRLSGCILSKAATAKYISVENALIAILAKDCNARCMGSNVLISKGTWSIGRRETAILHVGYEMEGIDGQTKIFNLMQNQVP